MIKGVNRVLEFIIFLISIVRKFLFNERKIRAWQKKRNIKVVK